MLRTHYEPHGVHMDFRGEAPGGDRVVVEDSMAVIEGARAPHPGRSAAPSMPRGLDLTPRPPLHARTAPCHAQQVRLPLASDPWSLHHKGEALRGSSEGALTALRGAAQVVAGGRLLGDLQRVGRARAPVQRQRPERQRLRHAKVHAALGALHHAPVTACEPQSSSLVASARAPESFQKRASIDILGGAPY